jgi:hypothetical protein
MAYVTVAQVRALDGMADSVVYPDARVTEAITRVEARIDRVTGTSWEYRVFAGLATGDGSQQVRLRRDDGTVILYPQTITSATVDGDAVADTSGWELFPTGVIWREDGFPAPASGRPGDNVTVAGTAGRTSAAPAEITEAAGLMVRYDLASDASRVDPRAMSITSEYGLVRLSTPSARYPTGIPRVDEVLNSHRQTGPVVG